MPLSPKHQAFVDSLFLHNMNATEAYCDVYGVDRVTGAVNGSKLLRNAKVSAAVKSRLNENTMSADEVLHRLADIARGDVADLMDFTTAGYTINLTETDPETGALRPKRQTRLVKKVKQKVTTFLAKQESGEDREVVETELELYGAIDALTLLGKHHSLFIDRDDDGKPIVPITTIEVLLPPEESANDGGA